MAMTKREIYGLGLNIGCYIAGLNSRLDHAEVVQKASEFLERFPQDFDYEHPHNLVFFTGVDDGYVHAPSRIA